MPLTPLEIKLERFNDLLKQIDASGGTFKEIISQARNIAFERFDCPMCKNPFQSRSDCLEHLDNEHPIARVERPMFCEICLKTFVDRKALEQHESYHKRVQVLVESGEIEVCLLK